MGKLYKRSLSYSAGIAATAIAVTMAAGPTSDAAAHRASFHGTFDETSLGIAAGYDINGSAKMTVETSGTTVRVNVAGLDSAKAYGSHLHNGSCLSGGGGHYQDIEGGAVTPPNELWLTSNGVALVPNVGGVAHGVGSAIWQARVTGDATHARSVVVHEPGSGARIACADLE